MIVHLYEAGDDLVDHLNGMFALPSGMKAGSGCSSHVSNGEKPLYFAELRTGPFSSPRS